MKEENTTPNPRRAFFKAFGALSAGALIAPAAQANSTSAATNEQNSDIKYKMASIIDLGACDGCKDKATPACVQACKDKNVARFPKPIKDIPDYFPRKVHEDYSKQRDNISRLSPYNWTYVEKLQADGKDVYLPRRCMHCDDPTCAKLCPFGTIGKDENGAVNIDENFCFGGAKCRDVCPWGIPQRQAGVGIYLKILPKLAGGGAMFKCDMCADLLAQGQKPACEVKCPKNAIIFGEREQIAKKARELAAKYKEGKEGTFIYGDSQNGGTSTFYVSPVSFESISAALNKKHGFNAQRVQKLGVPHMNIKVNNFVSDDSALIKATLMAPLIGVAAGVVAAMKAKEAK